MTRTRRRGIALMEMLGQLMIIAAVSLLVTDMIITLLRVTRATAEHDTLIARVDAAADQLRRDVWAARAMRVSPEGVELETVTKKILWRQDGAKLVRTIPGEPTREWIGLPSAQFSSSRPELLTMTLDSGPGGAAKRESLTFFSQQMRAGIQVQTGETR